MFSVNDIVIVHDGCPYAGKIGKIIDITTAGRYYILEWFGEYTPVPILVAGRDIYSISANKVGKLLYR